MTDEAFDRADRIEETLESLDDMLALLIELGIGHPKLIHIDPKNLTGTLCVLHEKVISLKEDFAHVTHGGGTP